MFSYLSLDTRKPNFGINFKIFSFVCTLFMVHLYVLIISKKLFKSKFCIISRNTIR